MKLATLKLHLGWYRLVHNCRVFLEENEQAIYHDDNAELPKTLNGPQGNIAEKSVHLVRLVEWG